LTINNKNIIIKMKIPLDVKRKLCGTVFKVFCTTDNSAFAAVMKDGSVVTWGVEIAAPCKLN
jgi:capsule polysaccharide export protein KpsC/LpsZ